MRIFRTNISLPHSQTAVLSAADADHRFDIIGGSYTKQNMHLLTCLLQRDTVTDTPSHKSIINQIKDGGQFQRIGYSHSSAFINPHLRQNSPSVNNITTRNHNYITLVRYVNETAL